MSAKEEDLPPHSSAASGEPAPDTPPPDETTSETPALEEATLGDASPGEASPGQVSIEDAQPIDESGRGPLLSFPVVAIGASAGGVQALVRLFGAMPADSGCAFVVMMHLAPARDSMLPDVIARATKMTVEAVADGMPIRADRVYVQCH